MPREQVPFDLIDLNDIPSREPITPIHSDTIGVSKWNDALAALRLHGKTHGIRVKVGGASERNDLKSTLQTFLKTKAIIVEVLNDPDSNDFFAWVSDKDGRNAGPRRRSK